MKLLMNLKSKKRRPRSPLLLFQLLLCGAALAGGLAAQATGPQPGANDPMSSPKKLTLFPDQEIFSFSPDPANGNVDMNLYRTDGDTSLSLNGRDSVGNRSNPNPIVAASGRVLSPVNGIFYANVAYAQRDLGTSQIEINVMGNKQSAKPVIISDLADRGSGQYDTDNMAIATGDLDKAVGYNGHYHDEVAVAYESSSGVYKLAVLNFTRWADKNPPPKIATININDTDDSADPNLHSCDIPIGVAIGDFDGDGNNEVAVAINHPHSIGISIFGYVSDGAGGGTLGSKNTFQFNLPSSLYVAGTTQGSATDQIFGAQKVISIHAADLNGDGADELAIGYVLEGNHPSFSIDYIPALSAIQLDGKFNLAQSSTVYMPTVFDLPNKALANAGVQVTTGQLLFNPTGANNKRSPAPLGQHQVAIAWNDNLNYAIDIQAYYVSSDLQLTLIGDTPGDTYYVALDPTVSAAATQQLSLVAGGFMGDANFSQPTASLALSALMPSSDGSSGFYLIQTIAVDWTGLSLANQSSLTTQYDELYRVPLVAVDWDGKSIYLGAPTHLTVQNAVSTDYILEEPPKHSFWDETQVANVSNYDSNFVSFSDTSGNTSSTKSTDQTNTTTGSSSSTTVGATASVETGGLLYKEKQTFSASETTAYNTEYDQGKSSYDSQYGTRNFAITSQTNEDDYLYGRLQTTDVWRYPIYGLTQTNTDTTYNYYDIMFPGPTIDFNGGGLGFDWYQPIHENGNILTYPQPYNSTYNYPPDLGSYTDVNGNSVTAPLVPISQWAFDGTSGTEVLALSTENGNGQSLDYTHKKSESQDVKTSLTVSAEAEVFGTDASAEASFSTDSSTSSSSSWGNATTADNTTTTNANITLNKESGDPSQSYQFDPIVYITQDGTYKMSFVVPNPASPSNVSGSNFWASTYGSAADPALNLPSRFLATYSDTNVQNGWQANTVSTRKQMRGLFFRKATLNPVTQNYDLIGDAPVAGESVRIEARIYNESTAQGVDNVTVKFQAIPYDSSNDNEICNAPINAGIAGGQLCPASARTDIGQTVVAHLDPLQFTCLTGTDDPQITGCNNNSAFITWDTTNFGPSAGLNEYRIYVVLVPADTNDKYGLDGAPVPIQSMNTNSTPMEVTTATPHGLHTGQYVTMGTPGLQLSAESYNIFQVTYVDDTHFTLNGTTDVAGTYSGGGTVTPMNPGENNEGYRRIDVQSATTSQTESSSVQSAAYVPEAVSDVQSTTTSKVESSIQSPGRMRKALKVKFDDFLTSSSLQAVNFRSRRATVVNHLTTEGVTAHVNRPLRIRVGVFSSIAHPDGTTLLLFDGNPTEGAPAIASQQVHPGNNGGKGTYIWFDWMPKTTGTHHLYTKLLQRPTDVKQGNSVSSLDVQVQ